MVAGSGRQLLVSQLHGFLIISARIGHRFIDFIFHRCKIPSQRNVVVNPFLRISVQLTLLLRPVCPGKAPVAHPIAHNSILGGIGRNPVNEPADRLLGQGKTILTAVSIVHANALPGAIL